MSESTSAQGLLLLHALTGLHPGTGTALGLVDLPVQRERHTGWPTIPGSSLKGVLRATCLLQTGDQEEWLAVFGPQTANASDHAGALALTDARLLAFPVRSIQGVFAWVTCPEVCQRLAQDLRLFGLNAPTWEIPQVAKESDALCAADSPLLAGNENNQLILEEFDYTRTGSCDALADWIAGLYAPEDATAQRRMRERIVVTDDTAFSYYCRYATEVSARIGLEYETKTVKKGALFYEEFLPAESLFYSIAIASPSWRAGKPMTPDEVLASVGSKIPCVLQVGGDATIGKGLCRVWLKTGAEVSA